MDIEFKHILQYDILIEELINHSDKLAKLSLMFVFLKQYFIFCNIQWFST